jgi:hypothetical protein
VRPTTYVPEVIHAQRKSHHATHRAEDAPTVGIEARGYGYTTTTRCAPRTPTRPLDITWLPGGAPTLISLRTFGIVRTALRDTTMRTGKVTSIGAATATASLSRTPEVERTIGLGFRALLTRRAEAQRGQGRGAGEASARLLQLPSSSDGRRDHLLRPRHRADPGPRRGSAGDDPGRGAAWRRGPLPPSAPSR